MALPVCVPSRHQLQFWKLVWARSLGSNQYSCHCEVLRFAGISKWLGNFFRYDSRSRPGERSFPIKFRNWKLFVWGTVALITTYIYFPSGYFQLNTIVNIYLKFCGFNYFRLTVFFLWGDFTPFLTSIVVEIFPHTLAPSITSWLTAERPRVSCMPPFSCGAKILCGNPVGY